MDHVVLSGGRPAPILQEPQTGPLPVRPSRAKPLVVVVNADPRYGEALRAVLGRQYQLKEYASGEQAWASMQLDSQAAAVVCSKERLAQGASVDTRKARTDALRRWAHQHASLDEKMRGSLVIFRIVSEGVGVLSQRLARTIRRPEMMLADSLNCVWLCVDVPISSSVKFAMRLALGRSMPSP